ncbi:hypothetical protein BGZ93_010388 [Podila epicladia]|nr:hypothetical protein BGZ93_010388 [Podila epicladia]
MLQHPRDQGSGSSTLAAHYDQEHEEINFSDEEYEEPYEAEDYKDLYYDEDDCYGDEDDDQEDIYGDYSVNTKAPPRDKPTTTARTSRARPHSNVIPQDHQLEPPSFPPIPPEVLHLIFSYADLATLYRGISRVSRQFNNIARHYIELEGTWTLGTQEEEDDLLEKLMSRSVNVLKIKVPSSRTRTTGRLRPYDRWNWAWPRFIGFITDSVHSNGHSPPNTNPSNDGSLSDPTAAMSLVKRDPKQPCLINCLKKVIIDDPALPDLLPYLHRIQSLHLNISSRRYDLYLQPILKACSGLDTLVIDGHDYAMTFIHWNNDTGINTEEWINSHITHFSLTRASFSQETMEEFLGSCPWLTFFKGMNVHIRSAGASTSDSPHASNTSSLPLEPFYRQASFLCPRIKDFALVPIHPFRNSFDEQLALTAELFPHTQHLDVALSLTEEWSADPVTIKFLAQLNSITFIGAEACHEDMNSLLKHCRRLTRLSAPDISYTRPEIPSSVDQGVRAALDAAEDNRHRCSTPQERKNYNWRKQVPISMVRRQKLHQRVEKRLVREETISRRHQPLWNTWRCPRLRVLELRVGTAKKEVSAEVYEDVFRFLGHACPNLEQLTLHLNTLWVGQERQIESTRKELRTWTGPDNCTHSWHQVVTVLVWQESIQVFQRLGRLNRLERLIVHVKSVPGVLCPSDFAFLRGAGNKAREQDGMAQSVFCPRLQSMRICCTTAVEFRKTREEPIRERQFVNALKTIRPELTVSFK